MFGPSITAPVRAWRVDLDIYAGSWDSGIGAQTVGGRWNPKGVKAVYCALDAATAILEVAVHKGFKALDTVPHVLTVLEIDDPSSIFVVQPTAVPNPAWLQAGTPSAGQQAFGAELLAQHPFVAIPSVVSHHSWNLLIEPGLAAGRYREALQERLRIDTRLNPPP